MKSSKRPAGVEVHVVDDVEVAQTLLHPLRLRILESLRTPASAAAVARDIGETRQKVNYHLKELEAAGLVRSAGERRSGNFVETLYTPVARSFMLSPRAALHDARRLEALRREHALEHLIEVGDRLQRDAVVLLDRAAFDGVPIASAAVEIDVRFAGADDRAAFLRRYLEFVQDLCEEYGATEGDAYRVVVAAHPAIATSKGDEP